MVKTTQKLVLSFESENQNYRPAGHNLSPEQAVEEIQRLQSDGRTALIVEQDSNHRASSLHQCKPCQKAAEKATSKRTQASDQEQPTGAAASAEAAEGE